MALLAPRSYRRLTSAHLETAVMLARHFPDLGSGAIVDAIERITRAGAEVRFLDEAECNNDLSREEKKRRQRFLAKCAKAAAEIGCEILHGDDPRGYTVRLRAPGLPGNTWGGPNEGWGIV